MSSMTSSAGYWWMRHWRTVAAVMVTVVVALGGFALGRVTKVPEAHTLPASSPKTVEADAERVELLAQELDNAASRAQQAEERVVALEGKLKAERAESRGARASQSAGGYSNSSADHGTSSVGVATGTQSSTTVTGTFTTSWVLDDGLKPWPRDCNGIEESYQVQVRSGEEVLAVADFSDGRMVDRSTKQGIFSIECEWTYVATVSGAPAYEFVAVTARDADQNEKNSVTVSSSDVAKGKGPDLYLSFCPSCESGY